MLELGVSFAVHGLDRGTALERRAVLLKRVSVSIIAAASASCELHWFVFSEAAGKVMTDLYL